MGNIVGIDLGTTNSLVAAIVNGKPTLIPNERGKFITPSIVGFTESGELLVGEPAKNQAVASPESTISSIKRMMGSDKRVTVRDKDFSPQEISAVILKKLKLDAETYLKAVIDEAVITVPAYFTDAQRQATKDAGEIAGFKVERIVNEPTAAALAYGFNLEYENKIIMVFDLGGGTFDVSVIKLVDSAFKVLSTHGNNQLGGDDFDYRLVQYLIGEFERKEKVDLRKIPDLAQQRSILQRLKDAAENAKIELSSTLETTINLPFIYTSGDEPLHLNETITRAKFEELIGDLIEETANPVELSLSDAKLTPDQIDEIVLVGGSTRIPAVQRIVKRLMGKDPRTDVNPEEVVAVGAAIQGGIKRGIVGEVTIIDVAPFSLGIEVENNRFSRIISRNTAIPTQGKKVFRTVMDNQTEALIHVLQGESDNIMENSSLGDFVLSGIPAKPAGRALVDVIFDYDINGIVKVTARDRETGAQRHIDIKATKTRLSDDEVRLAQRDMSRVGGKLLAQREKSKLFFEAEGLMKDISKLIKKAEDGQVKMNHFEKNEFEKRANELKDAMLASDEDKIDELIDTISTLLADFTR